MCSPLTDTTWLHSLLLVIPHWMQTYAFAELLPLTISIVSSSPTIRFTQVGALICTLLRLREFVLLCPFWCCFLIRCYEWKLPNHNKKKRISLQNNAVGHSNVGVCCRGGIQLWATLARNHSWFFAPLTLGAKPRSVLRRVSMVCRLFCIYPTTALYVHFGTILPLDILLFYAHLHSSSLFFIHWARCSIIDFSFCRCNPFTHWVISNISTFSANPTPLAFFSICCETTF